MKMLIFSLLLYQNLALKLSYDISDGAKRNSYLGNIVQDGQILEAASDATFSTVRGEELIFVETKTGDIRTSSDVDREKLCKKKNNVSEVIVTPQEIFQLITLELTILDLNDHAPRFPSPSLTLKIAEDEAPGAVFRLDSAADEDSDEFGIEAYSIEPKNGQWANFFELFVDDYGGILVPKLKIINPLDYEKLQKLEFSLVATDKGLSPLSGSMEVLIEIEDINDHSPKFSQPRYILNISEMSHKGDLILRLKATDGDRSEENGKIQYEYTNQVPDYLRDIFLLDKSTGYVTIGAEQLVDYEIFDKVLLHVKATDGDKEDYATIEVNVLDANDNAPRIDVKFVDGGRSTVREDLAVGSFIAFVSVTDDDLGPAGEVNLTLEEEENKDFKLVPVQGTVDRFMLAIAKPLDREIKEEYVLTLIARDNGTSPQETIKLLKILVEDVNDNAPSFKHQIYNGEISENNEIGDTIVQITAFDPDLGENAKITYTIKDHEDLFFIDPETADLKALISFDAEAYPDPISINIIATDNGLPRRSASTTFILEIKNINDNSPLFKFPSTTVTIKENEPIGTFITQVEATDADLDDSVLYSFKTKTSFFSINSKTGTIKTLKSIDREHDQARFDLEVSACDSSNLCAFSSVIVLVEDINDNAPRIIWPMSETDVIQIMRNESAKDVIIGTIDVKDYDSGNAGKVNCQLEKNHNFLSISDCRVILTRDLKPNDDGLHSLRIIAKDNGVPQLSTSKQMNIFVTNELLNDTALEEIMGEIRIVPEKLISFNGGSILLLAFGGAVTFVLLMIIVASIVCARQQREKQLQLSSTPKKSPKTSSHHSPAREWRMDVMWESPSRSAGVPRSLCEPNNATDSLSYVDSGAGESLSDHVSSNAAQLLEEGQMVDSNGLYKAPLMKKPSFKTFVDEVESDRKSIELFDEDNYVPSYYH